MKHFSTMIPMDARHTARATASFRVAVVTLASMVALVSGCAGVGPAKPPSGAATLPATPPAPDLSVYLATFDQLAPGDPARQAAALDAALAAVQAAPTGTNRLRYALALGSAGHARSNPVEGRRLIAELLAGQSALEPQELTLANAFLREFDARVTLYADIARQREDFDQQLKSANAEDHRRAAALTAENQRLKKSLAEAERKLSAVAEMERSLIENAAEQPAAESPPPE
jgi:hypothetical protein